MRAMGSSGPGSGPSCPPVPQVFPLLHPAPGPRHTRPSPLAASASLLQASPHASLPFTPPRPISSHVSLPGQAPSRRQASPTLSASSGMRGVELDSNWGLAGDQLLPSTPPQTQPRGARSPGGRVLELESERLLDDAVVHLQQDHGGGCPGQGKEKQGRVRVGKRRKGCRERLCSR